MFTQWCVNKGTWSNLTGYKAHVKFLETLLFPVIQGYGLLRGFKGVFKCIHGTSAEITDGFEYWVGHDFDVHWTLLVL